MENKINNQAYAPRTETTPHNHLSATPVRGRLSAEEFALDETLRTVPNLTVTCASLGAAGAAAIMPLLRFQTTADTLQRALDTDPTVVGATELARTDERRLYWMEWCHDTRVLCHLLLSSQTILRDARASERHWTVEIFYLTREALQQTSEYCERYNLSFEIEAVRPLDPAQPSLYGLTSAQYEALALACQKGYFAVPRESDLDDLGAEMDISHQALSERLRRAHETLITAMLGGSISPQSASVPAEQPLDGHR